MVQTRGGLESCMVALGSVGGAEIGMVGGSDVCKFRGPGAV